MTVTHFLPVHLPEFETAETPAPDHLGRAQHVPVFSAAGTAMGLRVMFNRRSFLPGDDDVIYAALRLIEDGMKRGVL